MGARFELRGTVGLLTLAEPERRNALSTSLVEGALAALASPEARRARALVVAGEGRAFCAGANIGDLLGAGWMTGAPTGPTPMDLFQAIDADRRVTIAATHGLVLGGGCELTLCCDLVVAAEDTSFALPELGLGVMPNTGLARLVQLVGRRRAMDVILTRRRVEALEASTLGLVSRIVPVGEQVESAIALARNVTDEVPPGALAAVKAAARRAAPLDWNFVRAILGDIPEAEWREGLGSFAERRKPDFSRFWNADA